MFRFLLLVAALGLAACGSAPPPAEPAAPPPTAPAETAPPGAPESAAGDDACTTDADCEIVELACCDHCNGGKLGAFNKAHASKHKPTCEPTGCTKRGCGEGVAKCVAQRCTATTADLAP